MPMRSWLWLTLVVAAVASAEDAPLPARDLEAAARDAAGSDAKAAERARAALIEAGTASLVALKAEILRRETPGELARLAEIADVLSPRPREWITVDSEDIAAISWDGSTCAVRSDDDRLLLLAPGVREECREEGLFAEARGMAFISDREIAVLLKDFSAAAVFDTESRSRIRNESLPPEIGRECRWWGRKDKARLFVNAEGRWVLKTDARLRIQTEKGDFMELTNGNLAERMGASAICSSRLAAMSSKNGGVLHAWDAKNLKMVLERRLDHGSLLAGALKAPALAIGSTESGEVALWKEKGDFGPARRGSFARDALSAIALSPGGEWLAEGAMDGRVTLRLADSWEKVADLQTPGPVTGLEFSRDGSTLAIRTAEKIHLYAVRRRQ